MAEFFSMGGYGFYIWCSFAMALLLLVIEPVWLMRQHKVLLRQLARMSGINDGGES